MEQEPDEQFRMLIWQKLLPLLGLPVFGLLLLRAPMTAGWTLGNWCGVGAVTGAGLVVYLLRAWQQTNVVLNSEGMRMYLAGRIITWPWADLMKVKQVGRFRVRMCYDMGWVDGQHTHVSIDMTDSDAFADAMLDRYALSQGRELDEPHVEEQPEARAA